MNQKKNQEFYDTLHKALAYFDELFLEAEKDIVKRLGKSTSFYEGAHVAIKSKEEKDA